MANERATRASARPGDEPIKGVADDRLELTDYLFGLLRYLETVETPFVVGVFGGWGSGKTSFLNMMEDAAHSREYSDNPRCTWRVVRVNPWECDDPEDAKRLLASSLWKECLVPGDADVPTRVRAFIRTREEGIGAVVDAVGAVVRLQGLGTATRGLFSSNGSTAQKYRDKFASDLRRFLGDKGRVLVLIDDLDRAPRRVIPEVLETIKLYLNQEGCVFVLAADPEVVAEAIRHIYGQADGTSGISGEQYLEKIVQLPFYLPRLDEEKTASFFAHCSTLMCEERGISEELRDLLVNEVLQRNPRAIKRFCMTHGFLATVRADLDAEKLAKALAVQMAFPVFFKSYHIVPGLLMRDQAVARGEDTDEVMQERWNWASQELGMQRAQEHVDTFAQSGRLKRVLGTDPSFADERDCGTYLSLMSVAAAADGEPGDRFSQAVAMLSSENPAERRQAALVLAALRDTRAVEPLIEALGHEDAVVRAAAATALAVLGDERAIAPLIEALQNTSEELAPITFSLPTGQFDRGSVTPIPTVKSTGIGTAARLSAIHALSQFGDQRALAPLVELLSDRDPAVCAAAASALRKLDGDAALGILLQALSAPDPRVRSEAARALGWLGDRSSVTTLTAQFADPNGQVRAGACRGLGQLGADAEDALPSLRKLEAEDEEEGVREKARDAVAKIEAALRALDTDQRRRRDEG